MRGSRGYCCILPLFSCCTKRRTSVVFRDGHAAPHTLMSPGFLAAVAQRAGLDPQRGGAREFEQQQSLELAPARGSALVLRRPTDLRLFCRSCAPSWPRAQPPHQRLIPSVGSPKLGTLSPQSSHLFGILA